MTSPTPHRRERGAVLPVLLVLALVVAAGAANYWRNLKAEPPRPYRHYADAEVDPPSLRYEERQRNDALPRADPHDPQDTEDEVDDPGDAVQLACSGCRSRTRRQLTGSPEPPTSVSSRSVSLAAATSRSSSSRSISLTPIVDRPLSRTPETLMRMILPS